MCGSISVASIRPTVLSYRRLLIRCFAGIRTALLVMHILRISLLITLYLPQAGGSNGAGWTLQELTAPTDVLFFDSYWNKIGSRERLRVTNIISVESGPLQSPLPSLDRSIRCSNLSPNLIPHLSRALSPEHADKLIELYLRGFTFSSVDNRL